MVERAQQSVLFGPSPPPAGLTARQARVLEALHELGRLDVDEAGAIAHELRRGRPHGREVRCEWCATDGRAVLEALVRKGHARPRRVGGPIFYVPVGDASRREEGEIPW